ncbi:hypothetical protein ACJJTC_009012 [Scirpophaga incertulas]
MWKKIKAHDYYLSYNKLVDIEIFLTDYITLWCINQTLAQFLRSVKDNNIINMKEDVMLDKALIILSNPEDIDSAQINQECNSVNLILSKRFGYPFKLNIILKQASRELFFQKITQPLLRTIQDLNTSQKELIKFVNDKDIEIETYKRLEPNMKISYYERTEKFDEENYLKNYTKYDDYFGSSSIPSSLLNKSLIIPEASVIQVNNQTLDIKQKIKEEYLSQIETVNLNGDEICNMKQIQDIPIDTKVETSIKKDPDVSVKSETHSPRKKIKKLNLL